MPWTPSYNTHHKSLKQKLEFSRKFLTLTLHTPLLPQCWARHSLENWDHCNFWPNQHWGRGKAHECFKIFDEDCSSAWSLQEQNTQSLQENSQSEHTWCYEGSVKNSIKKVCMGNVIKKITIDNKIVYMQCIVKVMKHFHFSVFCNGVVAKPKRVQLRTDYKMPQVG